MQAMTAPMPSAKPMLWIGRIISAFAVLFLVFDAVIKLINIQPVVDASILLGLPVDLAPRVGLLLLACLAIYLLPRTAVLGAILLTGYLGGALAIQLRIGAALFPLVFPLIIGALLWVGLFLRDPELRTLVPLRR
ncbi:DoxX family protein [soil metagenome]